MSNPHNDQDYMTFVVKREEGLPFNPKLEADGNPLTLCAASIYHEVDLSSRFTVILTKILMDNDNIDSDYLNGIGFSQEDASALGVSIDGLENINPPSDWRD